MSGGEGGGEPGLNLEYEEEGFSIKMLLNGAKSSALNDGRASRRSRGTGDACLSPVTRLMISEQICGPRGERIQRVLHPLQIPHSIPHLLTTEQGMTCKKNYTTGWGHRHRLRDQDALRCWGCCSAAPKVDQRKDCSVFELSFCLRFAIRYKKISFFAWDVSGLAWTRSAILAPICAGAAGHA
jgi:hypothetical protein